LTKALSRHTVVVYGAYGHTGRFVTAELENRGLAVVLSGRDATKLDELAGSHGSDIRVAAVDDASSLEGALDGADAVVNCAGPFAESAPALIKAASRAQIHYVDITAEVFVALETFERFARGLEDARFAVVPCAGFFGGLGDLAVTTLNEGEAPIDEVTLAVALDSWQPTPGTRLAGERRGGRRLVLAGGRLETRTPDEPAPHGEWTFPPPFGREEVIGELTTADIVTMSRHLEIGRVAAYLNVTPLRDLSNPATTPPQAAGPDGRSAQVFLLDVVVRRGDQERRLSIHGRDIYAVTAPIVGEVTTRLLAGRFRRGGVLTVAQAFDPHEFLTALADQGHIRLESD
jgi:short subunit dehydrogenase-like uncharacterized protein